MAFKYAIALTGGIATGKSTVASLLALNGMRVIDADSISHKILDELYEEDLIHFDVTENRIKNIIYNAITSFIADVSEIEDAVMDKIRSYKKRYIPGTDEFDILHEKLYREELMKRGME